MPRPAQQQEWLDPVKAVRMPPRTVNGIGNPEYIRARLEELSRVAMEYERRGQPWPNYGAHLKGIELEAKMMGFDVETIMDQRSEAQVFEDALKYLIENGPESMFETLDRELTVLENNFDAADSGCADRIEDLVKRAREEGRKPFSDQQIEAMRRLGKGVCSRVRRMRVLRERARKPIPPKTNPRRRDGVEAAHTLRFMLYVGRTNEPTMGAEDTLIFSISEHHCAMAVAIWEAKNRVHIHADGVQRDVIEYKGVMLVTPPRHTKSELGLHTTALELAMRPSELQALIVHAESSMASGYLQYVSALFRNDSPKAKRLSALFPGLELSDRDNHKKSMRLSAAESLRDPNLRSNGVDDKRSGANCNWLYLDDPVDQEERMSEASRNATADRVQNTWMTRLTGERAFMLYCTTLWHENDAACRLIDLTKKGKLNLKVLILPAGGPKENFKPLWPNSPYRENFLRSKYHADPVFYSLVYMCDPSSEEARLVRKLALFSPTLPGGSPCPQHADFMSDCSCYLSIDPAATTRKESDRCGVVYAAKGFLRSRKVDEAGVEHTRIVRRLRVLAAIREKCAPNQIIESVRTFAQGHPVQTVLMESVGGFAVLADWLRTAAGISVDEFKPGATKEVRLKECQAMLDDTLRSSGVVPVVEFPGQWEDQNALGCPIHTEAGVVVEDAVARCSACRRPFNKLVIDPAIEWLTEEIIRFGQIASDDGLDAVTQLCIYLRGELGIGETSGKLTMRALYARASNWKMAQEMQAFRQALGPRDGDQEDYVYHVACYK